MNFLITATIPTTLRKINGFANLPDGWHYGEGGPISQDVLSEARKLFQHLLLLGFTRTDAFPGANGELQLTAYHDDRFIGLTIEPDLVISLVYEVGGRDAREPIENAGLARIQRELREIAGALWNISGSSILGTSTTIADVSPNWPSRNQPAMVARRLYTAAA